MLIDCMMADIAEVLSYLPTAILVGAAYALVAGIVFRFMRKRAASSGDTPGKVPFGENSVFKLTISTLLVIYVVVVLMTVFFSRELGSRDGIDMRILGTWGTTMQDHAWVLLYSVWPVTFFLVSNWKKGYCCSYWHGVQHRD